MIEKLKNYFDEMVVYKDLRNNNFFSSLSLPSFTRDWLLRKFEDEEGHFDNEELSSFVHRFIPKKNDWISIKSRIVKDNERVRMLAKISVEIDIRTGDVSFALPDFGLSPKETIIEDDVWESCKDELVSGREVWGMIELAYRLPDDTTVPKTPGKIRLVSFRSFCPYTIDLEFYKNAREKFDIHEVIKNTAASFEGTCTQKKISIELLLATKHLPVYADKRKIHQVLYNLLDNAIKFSDPESTVTIETTERGEKVYISVKDYGIGIPRNALNKIWERFYKTDLSRGKDKKGTGLGLAIVKEAVQAHGENINVVSTEGVGTEFIFSLPKASPDA